MPNYTNNLNLLKKDPATEGNDYFNIETMLNENWDKIDAGVQAKVDNLAGAGRATETVKGNADAIAAINQTVTEHEAEDATTASKGHVQLGTTAGTAAEGNHGHTEYIPKSLATAANDFLVASGAGAWVKKTSAEVRTLLACALTTGFTMTAGEANFADFLVTRAYLKDYAEVLGTTPETTGTVTLDLTTGNTFNITPTGAVTFAFSNPPATGRVGSITLFINNSATVYAKTFPASVEWDGGTIPDMSTASKTIIITLVTKDAGVTWFAGAFGTKFTT